MKFANTESSFLPERKVKHYRLNTAEFKEEEHKRDSDGKFSETGGEEQETEGWSEKDFLVDEIDKKIEKLKEEYEYVGIRSSDNPNETIKTKSYVWVDGTKTAEELPGLSATDSEGSWYQMHIEKEPSHESGFYDYKNLYIVAGDVANGGNDTDEIIIEPEYIEKIKEWKQNSIKNSIKKIFILK